MGLTYQDPPPAEEGISINFGFSDEGFGEIEPESTEDITEIVEEEIIEEQIESTEEIFTQSVVETPAVEKTAEKKKVIEKEEPKEEVFPNIMLVPLLASNFILIQFDFLLVGPLTISV
jgi:hypothetical protein